jgi:hypothetical protein
VSVAEIAGTDLSGPTVVPYMPLGMGLCTALDPHALQRGQLSVSVNSWSNYAQAESKRPGSVLIWSSKSNLPAISLHACRFNNTTYLIEVKKGGKVFAGLATPGSTPTQIGTVSPTTLFTTAAEMFDPTVGANGSQVVFLCDGIAIPQFWKGPGSMLQPVAFGANTQPDGSGLPSKDPNSVYPITPQYVSTLGNNSHLFYSGDADEPSAVYVSDPFYPQSFNSPAMQVNPTKANKPGQYIPAIVGNNDGVDGGPITGLDTLGSAMIVFKECAVYAMIFTVLLGEVPAWQVVQVSNDRGCLSPRSITAFDTFITFLAIDGVYATDGNTIWQISGDVPTFFDSTQNGTPALIVNRQTAIGVRQGQRLLLWFQALEAPITSGLWFDFSRQAPSGNPLAGQIEGMNVGGAVQLTGAKDSGNMAWCDAALDQIGLFGLGYADLGPNGTAVPITVTLAGKADLLDDVFGAEAVVGVKDAQAFYSLIELLGAPPGAQAQTNFQGAVIVDNTILLPAVIAQLIAQGISPIGVWGQGIWGAMKWGGSSQYGFAVVKTPLQNAARGHLLQYLMTESSVVPWIMIGYALYANYQPINY